MTTKPILVEYLVIVKQQDTFCDSDKSLLQFLAVDSSISINEKNKELSLIRDDNPILTVSFSLVSDLVPQKKERYFKLTLTSIDRDKISEFDELTKLLEKNISKLDSEVSINVLWNDIARQYAIEGYTLINEVENLLRRLIANFMLINVGYNWHLNHIPGEVENRDNHLKSNYSDYLHQTYFSDLKTILFEGQREINLRNIGDIQLIVQRFQELGKSEIPIEELKGVVAKSLWEKHFSKETEYKKSHLQEDLEKLNSLRNEIAHNRHIKRETLGKIEGLSKKIITTLKLEINDLPNKVLTEEERTFQSSAETSRIAGTNYQRAEFSVFEWYCSKFDPRRVGLNVKFSDIQNDIIVNLGDDKILGAEIKVTSLTGIKVINQKLSTEKLTESYFPNNLDQFTEFHLVLVLENYFAQTPLPGVVFELKRAIDRQNPKCHLVIGFLDNNMKFVAVMAPSF